MSSFKHTNSSKSSRFDEHRWVIQIRRTLEEELEEENDLPVCIFNVPKSLMACDPDSFTPQEVAIGPYHHWRPELYEMERYKLAAAKRAQKHLHSLKFQDLVDQLVKYEPSIRACYHKYLDFSGETLAWMMAIDASFMLEFLQVYAIEEGKVVSRDSSKMSHLFDYAGRKTAQNAILRDLVMLENQIPLFVIRKMLKFQFSTQEEAEDMLVSILMGFCKELSPFKMMEALPNIRVSDCSHLLDFLYDMVTPKLEGGTTEDTIEVAADQDQNGDDDEEGKDKSSSNSNYIKQFLNEVWKILSKLNKGPIHLLKKVLLSKPVKVFLKLPWTILSNLPGLKILKTPVEYFFFGQEKGEDKPENENSNDNNTNKPPLIEEIAVPSVTDLSKSGVRFLSTNGSISTINFDPKTFTLYLPTISLDVNTETVLRNLVAYEASNVSGPLVFTRYTELMNGIIDTEEDVKLLRAKGIILNRLKSDEEVANLWNGMSKSIRLTKVPFLDKVIEDVNKYHDGRWKVKVRKFMKIYIFGSWQLLTLLAAIILLLLMGLQAFCSVYTCARVFHTSTD
ncbi:hypothetical protein UlMin_017776 [Ulmus minor]